MAKGSQLTQLKSALSQAGLNRQPPSGKKRKRTASSRDTDKDKKAQKIEEIHRKLNPFDVKVTKLKHDVVGRKLKGVTGRPQESKQTGIEQRKKTLLKEYEKRNHAGGIIDRRFGENDPTMTPEERMLERFTKERQRASRGVDFNLEDEDDLTHYGQSLSRLDDFEDTGLGLDEDDDESDGKIDRQTVKSVHFGGFGDGEDDEKDGEPSRKKSKAEVMAEVIAKSKQHKFERQVQRQQDAETRHQLDQELDDIRGLLFTDGSTDAISSKLTNETKDEDVNYDQLVRELALDKRAQPKDRTKTEEELALEAKEALEKAERKRQKRMMGEDDESSDDERAGSKKKARRIATGDDLEDDFNEEGDMVWDGLGAGLGGDADEELDSDSGDDEQSAEELSEELPEDNAEDSGSDEDVDDTDESDSEESDTEELASRAKSTTASKGKGKAVAKELPFMFPCPETFNDFLEIIEDIDEKDIPTVVQRIRALYHPSLGQDNKYKLQALIGVLIDYILHITSLPDPSFTLLPLLLPHLHTLSKSYPIESADHFNSKLKLMQKNLTRGLGKGATLVDAKTWPGPSELALLWMISHIWPTSDMNHAVVSPARLLMGAYLGLGRVRSLKDIASGLFLCTLFLRYEEYSKRLVPEVVVFLCNAILHLAPHSFKNVNSLPGSFPCPDFNSALCRPLRISKKGAKDLQAQAPNLVRLLARDTGDTEQDKLDLFVVSLELLRSFADLYKSSDAFIELFQPALAILDSVNISWASEGVKTKYISTKDMINRLLKFSRQSRKPLTLQAHKPIPIATYIPKFENNSSSYLRKNDPDHERAAASKLRYQYKQERKGAIRELRKDARFLSAVKEKGQMEKDKQYGDRMKKVFSTLESERAEQKKMDREKVKEKR
ncbi:Nop14-like protein [Fomitiporia mediterranea MF3/22]|uniref:Nop14-like protein n=1 Tax=Fomitiporia mediterranea (strain MF3/22) TaxID=694068 RepID=UPI0004408FA8|nr:Nop14-like protein [Fomitiporia mediterranea MF3/22]EJD01350.1 Nop14-like protein [Fomitiporia mediterranea MF3/22]